MSLGEEFAQIMIDSADEKSPWAAFTEQSSLWNPENLKKLAEKWKATVIGGQALGDASIVEESVCNLAAGEVQTFADSCDGRRLFTNSTRIAVTFRADTPQNGTITLWNITDVTKPYPAMFYEVDGRTARCEFTNLSSAERYFVLCDGLSGDVTLSDGRPTDLWESFLDLLHTLFPR